MPRPRFDVPCENCGAILNLVSSARRHCQTDDCRLGYVVQWYLREESYDSEGHMYWSGPRGSKSAHTPGVAMAYAADYESNLRKRQYRVLDIAALVHEGKQPDTTRRWKNQCGDLLCVALAHWSLADRGPCADRRPRGNGVHGAMFLIRARLDAAPLLRLVDRKEALVSERWGQAVGGERGVTPSSGLTTALKGAIRLAREQGTVTVSAADAICIDYLKVHPYEVYGDAFYEAGTDAA